MLNSGRYRLSTLAATGVYHVGSSSITLGFCFVLWVLSSFLGLRLVCWVFVSSAFVGALLNISRLRLLFFFVLLPNVYPHPISLGPTPVAVAFHGAGVPARAPRRAAPGPTAAAVPGPHSAGAIGAWAGPRLMAWH